MTHILHISDLHRSVDDLGDQQVVLDAFVRDINDLSDQGMAPDIIVFTGDVVKVGDNLDNYLTACDDLSSLIRSVNVDESKLIICPGNHDASRSILTSRQADLSRYREEANTRDGLNRLLLSPEYKAHAQDVFRDFNSFVELFSRSCRSHKSEYVEVYLYPSMSVGIVALNTAIMTGAGLPELRDKNNLAVGEHALREALRTIPAEYAKIACGHHPTDWLNEQSRLVIEQVLASNTVAYLHGHMHDAQPRLISGLSGQCLHSQSGSLFSGRENNGYSILSLGTPASHLRLSLRTYYPIREAFSAATDRAQDGVFYVSDMAKSFWLQSKELSARREWVTRILIPFLDAEAADLLMAETLKNVFVEPEFERDVQIKRGTPIKLGSEQEIIRLADILGSSRNYILSAPAESGKTTLLRHWALSEARSQAASTFARIPIYFRFFETPKYKAKYQQFMRSRLPELYAGCNILEVATHGHIVFLVDDVDFKDDTRLSALESLIKTFPKCRFIVTTATSLLASPGVQPMIGEDVEFDQIRLRPLRVGQLRALVEQHGITNPEDNERLINKMCDEMRTLSVPITPVTSTFLIQIYKTNQTATFVNRAKLIETFVEILLDRYAFQDLIPGSFDFRNKTHLLAFLAEKMVRSNNYRPDESVVLEWIKEYVGLFGFPYTAHNLLRYFVSARVLKRSGDIIEFKLRVFFDYFCATQMYNSPEFKRFVLEEQRYLDFVDEIGFYGAIARDDEATLTLLRERFEGSFTLRRTDEVEVGIQVERLQDIRLPPTKSGVDELYGIEDQIFNRRLTSEERDQLLYGDIAEASSRNQAVQRHSPSTTPARSIAQLITLSNVLRHMDLVQDSKKRDVLRVLLDGWNEFILLSLTLIPGLATTGRMKFEGVEYRINFPGNMDSDEIARILFLSMPVAVGRVAFYALGTEKLVNQIVEGVGTRDEPIERQLLRFFILADIGIESLGHYAQAMESQVSTSRYLSNVLIAKLNETLLRFQYNEQNTGLIREVAAGLLVRLTGAKGTSFGSEKGKIISNSKRHELALRLRLDNEARRTVGDDSQPPES